MINLKKLVITDSNSYINAASAIRLSAILYKLNILTKIEVLGKNKCALIFFNAKMEEKKYKELKKLLNFLNYEIYNVNPKHQKRRSDKKQNINRIKEEEKYNKQLLDLIK